MMRLKELREERNLTQANVAKAIQTNQRNIGRWENGENQPTSDFIVRLADFFECSTDYLLGRSDDFGNVTVRTEQGAELSSAEKQLLGDFRSLSEPERKQATDYVQFLAKRR